MICWEWGIRDFVVVHQKKDSCLEAAKEVKYFAEMFRSNPGPCSFLPMEFFSSQKQIQKQRAASPE